MNEPPDLVITVFNKALQLGPAERSAYLDRVCAAQRELRQQVEILLRAHDRAGEFLGESVVLLHEGATTRAPAGEGPGDWIGHYKLLQQIGEGGCGVVFMAEQEQPLRRRVALKLIKPGMDTRSVIARFEAERQALALMDHPGLAKVFDAGVTPSGRPYFVMELIRGIRITDHCDQNALRTEDRLKLFIQVCHAVQHAHQKGIIHRDIKPSNILVTRTPEGAMLPVVIDFGVAKAITNQQLTDKTLFTAFEMLIGTPAYMSPEQAALTNADVDTRTDVYSLGVLLYELLAGSTPFDTTSLLQSGLDEVRRVIREEEPVRPSTRLSRLTGAELTKLARHRQADPPCLIKTVHGDLDWIVMQALEKDRTRRYATANELALDVERFLTGEAVSARPPSRLYKLGKTIGRNNVLFSSIGVIGLLLTVSLAVVSAALRKERRAWLQARSDQVKAETEATKSGQVTRFLEEMLAGVEPGVALGQDTAMLRGILDRTAGRLGGEMTNQPAIEAQLQGVIGRLYSELGHNETAEKMHLRELSLRQELSGRDSRETAAALHNLGNVYRRQHNLLKGEAAFSEALATRRRLLGNEHADVAATLTGLGAIHCRQGRLAEAETLLRESLEIRRRAFGNESLEAADSLRNLSIALADRGKREEAERGMREMLGIRRKLLGKDHPLVAAALMDMSWAAGFKGRSAEIEQMETEAFLIRRKVLGDDHPEVAKSIYSLGMGIRNRGDLLESHAVLTAALSIQRKLLGPDHPDVLATLRSLGSSFEQQRKWADAEAVYSEAMDAWRRRGGTTDSSKLDAAEGLVRALFEQRKFAQIERLLGEILTPEFVRQGDNVDLLMKRVEILGRQKRWREAADDAVWVIEHRPSDHYRYHQMAGLLAMMGDRPAYQQLCRRLLTKFIDTNDPYIAERMAADCLALPASGVDLRLVDELAARAVELGRRESGRAYFHACKALSEYRLENFAKALECAEKANDGDALSRAKALAVAAMSHWKLGNKEAAGTALAKGRMLAEKEADAPGNDLGNTWLAWVFAQISLDEAASLVESDPARGASAENP